MFRITHFRSEFVRQSQATIIPRVTMTQFLLVLGVTVAGIGVLKAPFWLAPLFIVAGYGAGYTYNGEIVWKRVLAYLTVRGRTLAGAPRVVNVQAEWDGVRVQAEQRPVQGMPVPVVTPVSGTGSASLLPTGGERMMDKE